MNYMPLPYEFLEEAEALTDEEYGRLIRWGQRYALTGEQGEPAGNERFYVNRLRMQLDRYREHYEEVSRKRSEAGRRGAAAKNGKCRETETDTDTETKTETETETLSPKERGDVCLTKTRPPTCAEVWKYCRDEGLEVDALKFVDYYQARGWMMGRTPMKDWRAAARLWDQNEDGEQKR